MTDFEFKKNDEFFKTNFSEIIAELYRILKYVIKIEKAPNEILPKISNSLENLDKILNESREILEEIEEKKQQVNDYLQNSQNYKDSLQAYEALKQAYKQKFIEKEGKILILEQEKADLEKKALIFEKKAFDFEKKALDFEKKAFDFEGILKEKREIIDKFTEEKENLKKQINNFSSLMKQMNLEKKYEQNSGQNSVNNREIELKICEVREELQRTKEEYCNRLRVKEQTIEKMQRKIDLLEKENAMNEDWLFIKENLQEKKEKTEKKITKIKGK